jgi:hypothetical protein
MRFINIVFAIALVANISFAQQNELLKYLPTETVNGFNPEAEFSSYNGDDLFYLINGGADVYLEYGFKSVISRYYSNSAGNRIKAEIYEMTDSEAAYGIFSLFDTNNPSLKIGDASSANNTYIRFYNSKFLVLVSSEIDNNEHQQGTVSIARFIESKLPSDGKKPELLSMLSLVNSEFSYPKFFRGSLGFSNVYNFGSQIVSDFSEGVYMTYGCYSVTVLAYKNEVELQSAFESAFKKISTSKKVSEVVKNEKSISFTDGKGEYVEIECHRHYIIIYKGTKTCKPSNVFKDIKSKLG